MILQNPNPGGPFTSAWPWLSQRTVLGHVPSVTSAGMDDCPHVFFCGLSSGAARLGGLMGGKTKPSEAW